MTLLNTPDANPAFLFALGQSLHWLEANQHEIGRAEELHKYIALGDKRRLTDCIQEAKQAGMVVEEIDSQEREVDDLEGWGLSDSWHSAFGAEASMEDLALCVNRHLTPETKGLADLHAVGQKLLDQPVLGPSEQLHLVVEGWNQGWKGQEMKALNLKKTQLDDLERWMYFLGWVRRFGRGKIVPDFTAWLRSWLGRYPRPRDEAAFAFWVDLRKALPLLEGRSLEDWIPEPISIALMALESRGVCRFATESDSPEASLKLRVGEKQKVFHLIEWTVAGCS